MLNTSLHSVQARNNLLQSHESSLPVRPSLIDNDSMIPLPFVWDSSQVGHKGGAHSSFFNKVTFITQQMCRPHLGQPMSDDIVSNLRSNGPVDNLNTLSVQGEKRCYLQAKHLLEVG